VKVLLYLGPSLDLRTAISILPESIVRPPIRHSDLISDIEEYHPTHVFMVDGTFSQELPVWHKECSFCALKGIKLYGSSSMGALRASELSDFGVLIGVGKIFNWYHEGVIEADDEVAVRYHKNPKGEYICDTCPLVNIRSGLLNQLNMGLMNEMEIQDEFVRQKSIHYTQRTVFPEYVIDQKRQDAIELLTSFQDLDLQSDVRPDLSYITPLFKGMMEREKRVTIRSVPITLQNIDSYISLHSPDHRQIRWDAQNRALVLVLCDLMEVTVTEDDIQKEWANFCARHHIKDWDAFTEWLKANAMSKEEFDVMTIQNARIQKLQGAHITASMFSRETKTILDYLRTHDKLSPWIKDCSDVERKIVDKDNGESVSMDLSVDVLKLLKEHQNATGLEIVGDLRDYVRETGIGSFEELRVCLERYALSRKSKR
jgi:hypothetical protein